MNFEHMNVKELRNELKSLNLKSSGNKSELISRLQNYHNSQTENGKWMCLRMSFLTFVKMYKQIWMKIMCHSLLHNNKDYDAFNKSSYICILNQFSILFYFHNQSFFLKKFSTEKIGSTNYLKKKELKRLLRLL